MSTGLTTNRSVTLHDAGPGMPESPDRFDAVFKAFGEAGLLETTRALPNRSASHDELALVHTPAYLALVEREVAEGRRELSTGDTAIGRQSLVAAKAAAGSVLAAVDEVCRNDLTNAFCLVRPPGHHASAGVGMGFCFYNNVAIGARYAQRHYGLGRVLIADWDVHHGNGTQDIFYEDDSVLFFSTHQSPWYPGTGARDETGAGKGRGATINYPLPAGAGRNQIFEAFETHLLPVAREFKPEIVFISAGFDSRVGDPLGGLLLTDADFSDLTAMLMDLAAESCNSRLISVLEGGYSLTGLASAATAHVRRLTKH